MYTAKTITEVVVDIKVDEDAKKENKDGIDVVNEVGVVEEEIAVEIKNTVDNLIHNIHKEKEIEQVTITVKVADC